MFTIISAAAEPVLGFNAVQVTFAGVTNNDYYYRPGNFWHVALNTDNADPGFDVMRGTNDSDSLRAAEGDARLSGFVSGRKSRAGCDSIYGGGFCETWSFPQQFEKAGKK
jgi:hypothetical protein